MDEVEKGAYFRDKKRKIDFVFIINSIMDKERENYRMLQRYLKILQENGLQIEYDTGQVIEGLTCIKIHAPNPVLDKFRDLYNIDLSCDNMNYKKDKPFMIAKLKWFQNDLMTMQPEDPLFDRAPKTFLDEKPSDYTAAERILLVEKILSEIPFSEKDEDRGYKMLMKKDGIRAAYPLHDSSSKWNWEFFKPLSDRQILRRYWANPLRFYQQQPLNLIEKYYGSEVAFYFAWLGFYSAMLVPAAILSLICLFWAGIFYALQKEDIIQEICESNQMLCPVCPQYEICGLQPLKHSCKKMKLSYILDNPATVVYSILMCFWGIIFFVLWKRKQAMLKLRWNLNDINIDNSIRPEFIKAAPIWRISSVTGQKEYFVPLYVKVKGYFLTFLIYLAMFILYMLGILVVMYARVNVLYYGKKSNNKSFKESLSLIEAFVSAFLTILVMSILDTFKSTTAKKMTQWQYPRTKVGYHRKYTTKIIILSLADVFSPIFYLGYFKGHFYEHPGDATQWTFFGMVKADVCTLQSCLVDLAALLFTLLIYKNFIRLSLEMLLPIWKVFLNRIKKTQDAGEATQWEEDYFLVQPKAGFLYNEYITMIIQYACITFFIVALPIMPIIALINNMLELRLDARKMLLRYRRIVPKKVDGINEWNVVIHLITVLGAISNPLLLAYSSSLIPKVIYLSRNNWSLRGYINSTLSEFDLVHYSYMKSSKTTGKPEKCQYYGKRYPPSHSQKYQHTGDFWHELAVKTIFFVVMENLCLLLSLLLTYIIPEIPRKVEIKRLEDQRLLRDTKLQRSKSQSTLLRINRGGIYAGSSRM